MSPSSSIPSSLRALYHRGPVFFSRRSRLPSLRHAPAPARRAPATRPLSTGTRASAPNASSSPGAGGGNSPPPPPPPPQPSRHAQFYTDYAAGMLPIALLGSAVYIGLRTWQQHLAHERFLVEAEAEIRALEAEVLELRRQQEAQDQESRSGQSTGGSVSSEGKRRSGWWPW